MAHGHTDVWAATPRVKVENHGVLSVYLGENFRIGLSRDEALNLAEEIAAKLGYVLAESQAEAQAVAA